MRWSWRSGDVLGPDALRHNSDQGSQYTSEQFQRVMADNGVTCSMSRSGNVWDSTAMESFFSSPKIEGIAWKTYRTRNQARADVFDYVERFYNPTRRHSTLGYLSPMDFEKQANVAQPGVRGTSSSSEGAAAIRHVTMGSGDRNWGANSNTLHLRFAIAHTDFNGQIDRG